MRASAARSDRLPRPVARLLRRRAYMLARAELDRVYAARLATLMEIADSHGVDVALEWQPGESTGAHTDD